MWHKCDRTGYRGPFGLVHVPSGLLEELPPVTTPDGVTLRRARFKEGPFKNEILTEVRGTLIQIGEVTPKPMIAPTGRIFFENFEWRVAEVKSDRT
jgi:hypothetical protein